VSLCLLGAALTLAGCLTVGPDYVPPRVEMPASWQAPPDPAVTVDGEVVESWWKLFEDPLLTRLIDEAARGNLDLLTAVARVKEARARLRVAAGRRYPFIETTAEMMRRRSSDNEFFGTGQTFNSYSVGFDASWEIDLFGRISRTVEAAAADFQASAEDRRDVMVTLYAEVARTYLTARSLQGRLSATRGNIESQRQVLDLTRSRYDIGLATDLDVAQAEQVLASSESAVPLLRIELNNAINTIDTLLGHVPGTLREELSMEGPIPLPPARATVGVPADLLRRRPDIRRAERQLAAQTARIGVATADLYPRLSLLGSLGLSSLSSRDLFDSGSRVWSLGPSLGWYPFEGGRLRGAIEVQDALTEQALLSYEQTVLNALSEVENALFAYGEHRVRLSALERMVASSRRAFDLALQLYREGLSDFQGVLDAQRTLFDFDNQLAEGRGDSAVEFVLIYKALGGGWNPDGGAAVENRESAEGTDRKTNSGDAGDFQSGTFLSIILD